MGSLFDPEPPPHSAQADLELWRWMAKKFAEEPMPTKSTHLRRHIAAAYEEATGRIWDEATDIAVEVSRRKRRDIHESSADWWKKVALPILLLRLAPFRWTFKQALKHDKAWGKAGGTGPRPTALWNAVRDNGTDLSAGS